MTPSQKEIFFKVMAAYIQQTSAATRAAVEDACQTYADVAELLLQYFDLKFNPQKQNLPELAKLEQTIDGKMPSNPALRMFFSILKAMVRTNFFLNKEYVSFKILSRQVSGLPQPRPMAEIFVYSDIMDGVHLRFGKIARGGIRWSDRKDDFRTEVLSLVKAQQVKNVVIVPVGSKGGFFPKHIRPEDSRDLAREKAIEAYKVLIYGILDLTDNIIDGKIVPPAGIVRYDEDDPYLVVAADKGTASFSDIANALSDEREFWLSDAFASGGSSGYSHKGMGITAKGAWESVKRHFREIGRDCQTQDFTAVGVGGPEGDVFGNALLMSKHMKLLAAFGPTHIFLDPDPDTEVSYNERKRLFDAEKSWADYDISLLSKGGAIIKRSEERVHVSDEVKKVLDLQNTDLTPNELIQAILHAPVDLLFFGGIGTYVKSSLENNTDAKDNANNDCRVNGDRLRALIVGEGANLGMTQSARIEYAVYGGRVNSDAIDNSGGVDMSDHEVNAKILLNPAVADGKITREQRNEILHSLASDMERLVLRDNYLQTQILSYMAFRGAKSLPGQKKLIHLLEREGRLDRALEALPSDMEMDNRFMQGKALTRPEMGVLLAYAKMALYEDILNSDLPEDPVLEKLLFLYFPERLRKEFPDYIRSHRLRREIIATVLTNDLINRTAVNFVLKMQSECSVSAVEVAKAYAIVTQAYDFDAMFRSVEARDGKCPVQEQFDLFRRIELTIENQVSSLLRRGMEEEMEQEIARVRAYPDEQVLCLKKDLGLS